MNNKKRRMNVCARSLVGSDLPKIKYMGERVLGVMY
jgi:hypothetical protein